VPISFRPAQATGNRLEGLSTVRLTAAFQAGCTALIHHDNGYDAMTSVRLNGRYKEPDLGLKEHTMGQVIANASNTGHRR
jgi:hypothetical protein